MRPSSRILALAVALALAVVLLGRSFLTESRTEPVQSGDEISPPSAAKEADHGESPAPAGGSEADDVTPAQVSEDRAAIPAPPEAGARILALWIRNESGAPLAGAEVSWTALPPGLVPEGIGRGKVDPARLEDLTRRATSDESGAVFLEPDGAHRTVPTVVWATRAGRRSGFRLLEPLTDDWPDEFSLTLDPAAGPVVRVLDFGGHPVEGASVTQFGGSREPGVATSTAVDLSNDGLAALERANPVFLRRTTTGAAGETRALAHPARSLVRAQEGELLSRSVVVEGQGEIVLTLSAASTARGQVTWPAGHAARSPARVVVYDETGGTQRPLDSSVVAPGGAWGPLALPIQGVTDLRFRLEGGGLIPMEERRVAPAPGEVVTVDFRPEIGAQVDVRVTEVVEDGAQVAVAGARVGAAWETDGGWIWSLTETGEDGRARLEACPTGLVWVRADKPGYGAVTHEPFNVPVPEGAVAEISLARAGTLRGRCTFAGEPVEDFDVVYWPEGPEQRQIARFTGRSDGSFEIPKAPIGSLHVLACSSELPASEVVHTTVTADVPAEVELALSTPVRGRGRVLDGATLEPVPGAWIELYVTFAYTNVHLRGGRCEAEADGSFDLELFPDADARIQAGAPGYVAREALGFRTGPGRIEFGVVALAHEQAWEVRLIPGNDIDPTTVEFQADGPTSVPYTVFPVEPHLRFDGLAPGIYDAWIFTADGLVERIDVELHPGRTWRLDVPLSRARPLRVEYAGDMAELGAEPTVVFVGWRDSQGNDRLQSETLTDTGQVVFPYVTADAFELEIRGRDTGAIYAKRVVLDPGQPRVVRVDPRGGVFRVRVVDAEGESVPGATVILSAPFERGCRWRDVDSTDQAGLVFFRGIEFPRVSAAVHHPRHGLTAGVEARLDAEGAGELEVRLDGGATLRIRLLDGDHPVAGAVVHLAPAGGYERLVEGQTDDDGQLDYPRVGPGDYRLTIVRAGLWPASEVIHFTGSAKRIDLQVRRLGDLALELRTAEGQPAPGVPFTLRCLDLDADVLEWIHTSQVQASSTELATDADGRLELRGLPRGAYALGVVTPDGEEIEETLAVAPASQRSYSISLP